jgi:type III restriction enzyme
MLVLEVKGQDTQRDQTKREFLAEWNRAVNQHSGIGKWKYAVSLHPADVKDIV